jgi:hypothetical protein
MNTRRLKLTLVQPSDAIDAAQSRPLQLLALRCQVGDGQHRGLLNTVTALARHAVDGCLPPGSRGPHLDCLTEIQRWSQSPFALKARALRSAVLEATASSEAATAAAVAQMLTSTPGADDALELHLRHTLVRHARQASYYACSAVVLTLDALDEPRRAIDVPSQVAGAFAHQAIWSANREPLLARAREHAGFWQEHTQPKEAQDGHTLGALELQLLHEFLGVTWKAQRDAQFVRLCAFLDWALMLAFPQ